MIKRVWRWGFWTYLGLLLLSHLVGWLRPPVAVPEEMTVTTVPEFRANGEKTGREVSLAYHDRAPVGRDDAPVVVLGESGTGNNACAKTS